MKEYEAPVVAVLGTVESLTEGGLLDCWSVTVSWSA